MSTSFEFNYKIKSIEFCYCKKECVDEREIHSYNELLFYLDGNASLCTENFQQNLTKGSLILIPKGKYHIFSPRLPKNFTRLKVSFYDDELLNVLPQHIFNKITVLSEFSSITFSLLNKICAILEKGVSPSDGLFLYGAFFSVLTEFATAEHIERYEQKQNALVTQCIEYIEKNLTEDLDVEKISKEIKFAPSTVAHSFKKQMGIPLHKYIVQKRLYFAKTMLDKGCLPTKVYLSCGYTNYSSFYKAYIKMFGKTPKEI